MAYQDLEQEPSYKVTMVIEVTEEQLKMLVPSGTLYIDVFTHDGYTILDNAEAEVIGTTSMKEVE